MQWGHPGIFAILHLTHYTYLHEDTIHLFFCGTLKGPLWQLVKTNILVHSDEGITMIKLQPVLSDRAESDESF